MKKLGEIVDSITRIVGAVTIVVGICVFGCDRGREDALAEAKLSHLRANLQSVRAQLELYRLHHNGTYPSDVMDGLTRKTTAFGEVSPAGPCGPYLHVFPANPFVDDPAEALKTGGKPGQGWSYNSATGAFAANTPGHEGL